MSLSRIYLALVSDIKVSTLIIVFVVWINILGLYLMSFNDFILKILIIITFIFIFLIIRGIINNERVKKRKGKEYAINIRYIITLTKRQIKINRTYIFASILGLLVAVFVISSVYLINSSFNQSSFDRYVNQGVPQSHVITTLGIDSQTAFNEWTTRVDNQLTNQLTALNFNAKTYYTYGQITGSIVLGKLYSEIYQKQWVDTFSFKTYEWTPERLEFYKHFPTFNKTIEYNPNDTLLIIPSVLIYNGVDYGSLDFINRTNGLSINILADSPQRDNLDPTIFMNFSYPITMYWQPSQDDILYMLDNNLDMYQDLLSQALFLPNNAEWKIFNKLQYYDSINSLYTFSLQASFRVKTDIYINIPLYDDINVHSYTNKLRSSLAPLNSWANEWAVEKNIQFPEKDDIVMSVFSPLLLAFLNYQKSIGSLHEFIVTVSSPLIAISLYLVQFAVNMVQKRKGRIISIMKMRGTSNSQIQMMLTSEIFFAGTIAAIGGMVLSIPWTITSLHASGLFEFNFRGIDLIIPNSWYGILPVLGFLIAFDMHIMSILSMNKITTDASINKKMANNKSLFEQIYMDHILFIIGLVYWIFIYTVPIGRPEIYSFLTYDVGPYVLSIIIITAPIIFKNYFPKLLNLVIKFIAITHIFSKDIIWMVRTSIRHNMKSSSRMGSLIMTGFMLALITLAVPYSFDKWSVENTYYENGTDIFMSGITLKDATNRGYLNVDGIQAVSEVYYFKLKVAFPFIHDAGRIINDYWILAVDPDTFADAAYWQDYYAKDSLNTIISSISQENTIGISQAVSDALGIGKGDVFSMPQIYMKEDQVLQFQIKSTFYLFPRLIQQFPERSAYGESYVNQIELLMSIQTLKNMEEYYENLALPNLYIKVKPGYSVDEVAGQIKELSKAEKSVFVISINMKNTSLFSREQFQLIQSTLQGMLMIAIITILVAFIYLIFVNLYDRKREIGIYKANGMVSGQLRKIFYLEQLMIILSTLIAGIIIGFIVSIFFFVLITQDAANNIPPIRLFIDWIGFGWFILGVTIINVLSNSLPIKVLSRIEPGSMLRLE